MRLPFFSLSVYLFSISSRFCLLSLFFPLSSLLPSPRTALSGYSEEQVINYVMDQHKWYTAATEEWRVSGHEHFAGEGRLEDFLNKIRDELGEGWRERLRPQVERFYLKAMESGQEPRHEQLLPDEAAHRSVQRRSVSCRPRDSLMLI